MYSKVGTKKQKLEKAEENDRNLCAFCFCF